jgi:RNA polymerase sigma factor (sigma-70 family)
MSVDELREGIVCEYAKTVIRVKARQLCRRPSFSRSDSGDIEQDLYLHLLNQIQQFDPARGSLNTFIARVIDSAVAMLVRERRRGKRTPSAGAVIQSLEVMVDQADGPPAPLGATLSQADAERRTGGESMSGIDLFELADDVAHLINALPPELQAVCRARMNRNRSETESDLGLSRRNYDAAIDLIRQHFAHGGFGEI